MLGGPPEKLLFAPGYLHICSKLLLECNNYTVTVMGNDREEDSVTSSNHSAWKSSASSQPLKGKVQT